eukprot:augustus_masked-scaffold_12-processed-gene-9.48-mRNA-1 protein AED:0.14 eAED:0.18 QI:0/-1/0/1/-1/1/1/0/328
MDLFGAMPSPYLTQPITTKETHTGKGKKPLDDIQFALSSMQGWRVTMEDAHAHHLPTSKNDNLAFFGVFDGHGGDQAAIFAARFVLTFIENSDAYEYTKNGIDPEILARAMMEGFIDCDEDLKEVPGFRNGVDFSGSTGTACFITPDHYIVANTGDSRTVLCKADNVAFSTIDHKPKNPKETERVEKAGGRIVDDRVNGDLASARSFGDFRYKLDPNLPPSRQQITVLPDVTILDRSPQDQFLILACDGIWDVMSNLEATRYVLTALQIGMTLANTCEMMLNECLRKSSGDNMSIMIVSFKGAPPAMGTVASKVSSDEVREGMVDSLI